MVSDCGKYISGLTKRLIHLGLESGSADPILPYVSKDITWTDSGMESTISGKADFIRRMEHEKLLFPHCEISRESYCARPAGKDAWYCTANLLLNAYVQEEIVPNRFSLTLIFGRTDANEAGWEIVHGHASLTSNNMVKRIRFFMNYMEQFLKNNPDTEKISQEDKHQFFVFVNRYIFQELPSEYQRAFMMLSILPEFTEEQAVFIAGDESRVLLDMEKKHPLFLFSYMKIKGTYCFMPIMREFLLAYRKNNMDEDLRKLAEYRAAQWFLDKGYYPKAFRHAIEADDSALALSAVNRGGVEVLLSQISEKKIKLLENLSPETAKRHPYELCALLFDTYFSGNEMVYRKEYERMNRCFTGKQGGIALSFLDAYTAYNNLPLMIHRMKFAKRLTERWPEHPLHRAERYIPGIGFESPLNIPLYYTIPGKLKDTAVKLAELKKSAPSLEPEDKDNNFFHLYMAEIMYLSGNINSARYHIAAISKSFLEEHRHLSANRLYLSALIGIHEGRWSSSFREIRLLKEKQKYPLSAQARFMELCNISLQIYLSPAEDELRAMLKRLRELAQYLHFPALFHVHILEDHILSYLGEPSLFESALKHYEFARKHHVVLGEIHELLFIASARNRDGRKKEAEAFMEEALKLSVPDHLVIPFINCKDGIENLIEEVADHLGYADFVRDCKKMFYDERRLRKEEVSPKKEKLTEREKEIANLAAQGMKNRDIAGKLGLAEITIKKTLSHVYRKLHIRNKSELMGLNEIIK